jgi:hypothetical protein
MYSMGAKPRRLNRPRRCNTRLTKTAMKHFRPVLADLPVDTEWVVRSEHHMEQRRTGSRRAIFDRSLKDTSERYGGMLKRLAEGPREAD